MTIRSPRGLAGTLLDRAPLTAACLGVMIALILSGCSHQEAPPSTVGVGGTYYSGPMTPKPGSAAAKKPGGGAQTEPSGTAAAPAAGGK